jgi:hypothetical protein
MEHLVPEEFFRFIELGHESGDCERIAQHLSGCKECQRTLDLILLGEVPLSPEEESVLASIPRRTPEEILRRLRPLIDATSPKSGIKKRD